MEPKAERFLRTFSTGPTRPTGSRTASAGSQAATLCMALLLALAVGGVAACNHASVKSPDVTGSIRKSLDQAGLNGVSVSQNRDTGVVTLNGNVKSDDVKAQADSIAQSIAAGQVVANQIAVLPPGDESAQKTVDSDLDSGIDKNLDAALVQNRVHDGVSCKVKNGVVTLTGEVDSQDKRAQIEQLASSVPNVLQVVNELQIKNQKATTTVPQQQAQR